MLADVASGSLQAQAPLSRPWRCVLMLRFFLPPADPFSGFSCGPPLDVKRRPTMGAPLGANNVKKTIKNDVGFNPTSWKSKVDSLRAEGRQFAQG